MTPAVERFVLNWGEMGSSWGVNRSVAQVFAYVFVAVEPVSAEDIAGDLKLARSNVSNCVKELLSYQLIRHKPVKGDRRDFFEAETDPWEMMMRIAQARKQREIDPAMAVLEQSLREIREEGEADPAIVKRLEGLDTVMGQMAGWYDQMRRLPQGVLKGLVGLGGRVSRLVKSG